MAEWRTAPSRPRFTVSDDGHVMGPSGKVLSQWPNRDGYPYVMGRNYVHQLVCEAFHGPRPTPRHEVAHWDGNPANNHASNLRWATHRENEADRVRHGRTNAVLGADDVREIRAMHAEGGWTLDDLADIFSVHRTTVWLIIRRETWAWLDDSKVAS